MKPAAELDLLALYPDERGELLSLLDGLSADEWAAPTECPAWSVTGVALHILGDDLALLSRQRDGETPGVVVSAGSNWDDLMSELDSFNERWVEANSFFSPRLLMELLRLSGEWTHAFYSAVDPQRLGEAVPWAGPDPAPYWLLSAREYAERWIHQQQIRRAVGRPGLHDPRFVVPAVAVAMRGFPQGLSAFPAPDGTTVTLRIAEVDDAAWTVGCDGRTWALYDGAPEAPTVTFAVDTETAALLFSRALTSAELSERVRSHGDADLGSVLVAGMAAFFARTT